MRKSKARMSQRIREGRVVSVFTRLRSGGLFFGIPVPDYTDSRACMTLLAGGGGEAAW